MKKIYALFLSLILIFASAVVFADFDKSNPYQLANQVASSTIAELKANKDHIGDANVAAGIIDKYLFPYIDIKYAAYKVMGPSLKSLSEEDRQKFTDAFSDYMKDSFVSVLSKYTNQVIVPAEEKTVASNETMAAVKLLIRESGKQDLELVLKLRKNSKTGEWKAFDIVGEKISMLDAKISELSPIIKSQGVDAAIAKLKESTKK
jgi:phospholipid transport system substrate-binding protein